MPFKDFTVGEILTSSDVDTYLMSQVIIRCTSATRPPSPAEGWHIYETDTGRFLVYDGSAWVPEGREKKFALKNANESITNNQSVQNDDALFVPVLANTNYWVSGLLIYTGSTAGDLALGWSVPTGATLSWTVTALVPGSQDPGVAGPVFSLKNDQTFVGLLGASANAAAARITGVLRVAGTAGNLQLRWAQGSSNGTATIVYADSILIAERIG